MVSSYPSHYQMVSHYDNTHVYVYVICTSVFDVEGSFSFSIFGHFSPPVFSFSSPVSVAVGQCGYLGQRGEWETHC